MKASLESSFGKSARGATVGCNVIGRGVGDGSGDAAGWGAVLAGSIER